MSEARTESTEQCGINTKVQLDFDQRARAVKLEDYVSDDEYSTAAEIIHLRDLNAELLAVLKKLVEWQDEVKNAVPRIYLDNAQRAIAKAEGRS